MEVASILIPPINADARSPVSTGSEKEYFLHFGDGFDDIEFIKAFIERFEVMGWLRRSFGRRIGDPHRHWLRGEVDISNGYFPTSNAEKEAQLFGFGNEYAGIVSAVLGANLKAPVDFAVVLCEKPMHSMVNLLGFYGIPTLFARDYEELSKMIGRFIERVGG